LLSVRVLDRDAVALEDEQVDPAIRHRPTLGADAVEGPAGVMEGFWNSPSRRSMGSHRLPGVGSTAAGYPVTVAAMSLAYGSPRGSSAAFAEGVERETGLEPATFCLGSRHSTN
jgi:hypothetical protein